MRVIAGEFRSRRIKSVPGLEVRPTPDRLREALFNVLTPRVAGAVFLDCYAGSGSVGIEALSRGAKRVIFVEKNGRALDVLRDNLKSLGIEEKATVVRALAKEQAADIAFISIRRTISKENIDPRSRLFRRRTAGSSSRSMPRAFGLEEQLWTPDEDSRFAAGGQLSEFLRGVSRRVRSRCPSRSCRWGRS